MYSFEKSLFYHNLIDELQFIEIIKKSYILKNYISAGSILFDDFEALFFDMYLMLYKICLSEANIEKNSFNSLMIKALYKSATISKLRLRTAGSKINTYISLKYVLDVLFEKTRGSNWVERTKNELELVSSTKEDYVAFENFLLTNLKSLIKKHGLEAYLTKEEITSLKKISANNKTKLENDFFDLIESIYNSKASSQISKHKDKAISSKNPSSLSELIDAIEKNEMDTETSDADEKSEDFSDMNYENSNELLDKIKEDVENRYFSAITSYSLMNSNSKPVAGSNISELPQNSDMDEILVINGEGQQDALIEKYSELSYKSALKGFRKNFGNKIYAESYQIMKKAITEIKLESSIEPSLGSIDKFQASIKTLGIESTSINNLSFDEAIDLNKRIKSPSFIKFIDKVGRQKKSAKKIQAHKKRSKSIPIDRITVSNDLDLIIDDELIYLSLDIEAFENDFYDRYLHDNLLTTAMIDKESRHRGPIILCYDGSGSMEGLKIQDTRAHILAIIEIAKIQRRNMVIIQFAASNEPMFIKEINPLSIKHLDIFELLDSFICGGTDFEKPLSKAIEYIKKDKRRRSDILFITDGQCEIKESFKKQFIELKKRLNFKLYTVIMHAYTYQDYGDIGQLSDEVLEINSKHNKDEIQEYIYSLI